jgi:hypothetical protein
MDSVAEMSKRQLITTTKPIPHNDIISTSPINLFLFDQFEKAFCDDYVQSLVNTSSEEEYNDDNYASSSSAVRPLQTSSDIIGDPRIRVRTNPNAQRTDPMQRQQQNTMTEEEKIRILNESAQARDYLQMNMSRRCQYCGAPIPGEVNEVSNPQRQHIQDGGCPEWNFMKRRRDLSEQASQSIRSTMDDINITVSKKVEYEQKLKADILSLLNLNERYGSDPLCMSSQEWNERYDGGKKDSVKVSSVSLTSPNGGHYSRGRKNNEMLSLRDYSVDRTGNMWVEPRHFTRRIDDYLKSLRDTHPAMMKGIDQALAISNERIRKGKEQQEKNDE